MLKKLNFEKVNDLMPCIIQDNTTRKVLMLGYMNEVALEKTQKENRVTFCYHFSSQNINLRPMIKLSSLFGKKDIKMESPNSHFSIFLKDFNRVVRTKTARK